MQDWDDAYANAPYIHDSANYPNSWAQQAAAFRQNKQTQNQYRRLQYGQHEREYMDLFLPAAAPQGLVVFVHGGFWRAFDPSYWSHLAAGALALGWVVALPGYVLAPAALISQMTQQIGAAIELAATQFAGPICLAGHSAGGHLVTRMVCTDSPLSSAVRERLQAVTSISGLHDLRPLLKTAMNADWQMDWAEACAESPALLEPLPNITVTCWVGAAERPEFIRQNDLLALIWQGFEVEIQAVHAPAAHHFNVIEPLTDPDSALLHSIIG